ncbi:MAG TPA: DinB family protein [Ktedonobacteraceae bacterium]
MSQSRSQQIAALAQTHATLLRLTEGLADEVLDFRVGSDEWSMREMLAHLVDDEMYVMRTRMERIVKEDLPLLAPHDEKQWYATRNTTRDQLAELLSDFAVQRAASVALLRMLRESDWQRQGKQPEYGIFTAETWLGYWLEHDHTHIEQVRRTLEVYHER